MGCKPFFETKFRNMNRPRDSGQSLAEQKWKLLSLIHIFFCGNIRMQGGQTPLSHSCFNDQANRPTLPQTNSISEKPNKCCRHQLCQLFYHCSYIRWMNASFKCLVQLVQIRGWWFCLVQQEKRHLVSTSLLGIMSSTRTSLSELFQVVNKITTTNHRPKRYVHLKRFWNVH